MVPRSLQKQLSNQHPNLDRFWIQLGPIWGGFGGPRWDQVGTKSLQKSIFKTIKKTITSRIALGTDFDRFQAPTWPPRGVTFIDRFPLFWFLGPSWRQDDAKTPQEAPRGAQDSLQDRFWNHLGGFLVDFLLVFWLVWGSFRLLLFVVVLVCCFVGLLACWPVGSFIDLPNQTATQPPKPASKLNHRTTRSAPSQARGRVGRKQLD